MRADELIRRLISGELTNYSVVRTSLEPLHNRRIQPESRSNMLLGMETYCSNLLVNKASLLL
jgi:hypothetical protein